MSFATLRLALLTLLALLVLSELALAIACIEDFMSNADEEAERLPARLTNGVMLLMVGALSALGWIAIRSERLLSRVIIVRQR